MTPAVRDGIRLGIDRLRFAGLQAAILQLLKKREQPLLASDGGGRFRLGQFFESLLEGGPCARKTVPGAVDGLVQPFPREMVAAIGDTRNVLVPPREPLQEISRQEPALGADGLERVVFGGAHVGDSFRNYVIVALNSSFT